MKNDSATPSKMARFDVRLTETQKAYFERAARSGGYRSLTDFVIQAVNEKADKIIAKREEIIASEEDKTTFFDEVTMPQAPNRSLIDATKEYEYLFLK